MTYNLLIFFKRADVFIWSSQLCVHHLDCQLMVRSGPVVEGLTRDRGVAVRVSQDLRHRVVSLSKIHNLSSP